MEPPTPLILAGGESRRFGSYKAVANVLGRPLIKWVLDPLRVLGLDPIISVSSYKQIEVLKEAVGNSVRYVLDVEGCRGPICGVKSIVREEPRDLFIIPCDIIPSPTLFRDMLDIYSRYRGVSGVYILYRRLEPLPCIVSRKHLHMVFSENVSTLKDLAKELVGGFRRAALLNPDSPPFIDIDEAVDVGYAFTPHYNDYNVIVSGDCLLTRHL